MGYPCSWSWSSGRIWDWDTAIPLCWMGLGTSTTDLGLFYPTSPEPRASQPDQQPQEAAHPMAAAGICWICSSCRLHRRLSPISWSRGPVKEPPRARYLLSSCCT